MTDHITLLDVVAAQRRISGRVVRTPLRQSEWLSAETRGAVHLKLESLQVTNSFKARGAFNAAACHRERHGLGAPSLVTASAGNHGRALAWATRQLDLPLCIYLPQDAPRAKVDAIRALDAELRYAPSYDEAERLAKAHSASGDATFISAYSHPDVIAGAGTVALEIFDELPDLEVILVPVGGGGLVGGVGVVAKAVNPRVEVVGVEVEASHPFTTSLAAGCITPIKVSPSLADSLVGNLDPDTITFDLARGVVDHFVLAGEDELRRGIRELAAHEHLIAEGAGIAALAALISGRIDAKGRRVAVVVSGSNIDIGPLTKVLRGAEG